MRDEMKSGPLADPDPIFILGISERSGTNFLFHVLCLHPDCEAGGPIWENYLIRHLDMLVEFADRVYEEWNPAWRVEDVIGPPDVLLSHLGDGLTAYLNLQRLRSQQPHQSPSSLEQPVIPKHSTRLVTKTPSVRNLNHFFKVFPRAHLLILVRDGRAVVESGVRSFDWDYEEAMRHWADAAREIIRFEQQNQGGTHKYLLVRYEDLCRDTESELRRLFGFLKLSADRYDFQAMRNLPVVGSSEVRRQAGEQVHWQPVARRADFDPTQRWENWRPELHERFHWIAGDFLAYFGYPAPGGTRRYSAGTVWNRLRDARWTIRRAFQELWRRRR